MFWFSMNGEPHRKLSNAQVLLRAILTPKQNSISTPQARRLKGEKPQRL
jgi:hypothetical protein